MTDVDFYRIAGADDRSRQAFACRLIEKVYKLGNGIYVHATDKAQAASLDELLWTFRQGSFIPHGLHDAEDASCPVLIGYGHEPDGHHQSVLINLAPQVPGFVGCFERVAEIVNEHDSIRRDGRDKYRFYQDRGYPLKYHDLAGPQE